MPPKPSNPNRKNDKRRRRPVKRSPAQAGDSQRGKRRAPDVKERAKRDKVPASQADEAAQLEDATTATEGGLLTSLLEAPVLSGIGLGTGIVVVLFCAMLVYLTHFPPCPGRKRLTQRRPRMQKTEELIQPAKSFLSRKKQRQRQMVTPKQRTARLIPT
jgi:hypothetical protein